MLWILFFSTWTTLSQASIGDQGKTLPQAEIQVCLANQLDLLKTKFFNYSKRVTQIRDLTDFERRWVRNTINTEFNPARTTVHFEGWGPCSQNRRSTIYLLGGLDPSHYIQVRRKQRIAKYKHVPQRLIYLNLYPTPNEEPDDEKRADVVRTFAKAVGIADEAARPEAIQDPACPTNLESRQASFASNFKRLRIFSIYDPQSLVHSCHPETNRLSPGDLHTIKCLYQNKMPSTEAFEKSNCAYTYDPINRRHIEGLPQSSE